MTRPNLFYRLLTIQNLLFGVVLVLVLVAVQRVLGQAKLPVYTGNLVKPFQDWICSSRGIDSSSAPVMFQQTPNQGGYFPLLISRVEKPSGQCVLVRLT
jgi:hypothetical protein